MKKALDINKPGFLTENNNNKHQTRFFFFLNNLNNSQFIKPIVDPKPTHYNMVELDILRSTIYDFPGNRLNVIICVSQAGNLKVNFHC